VLTSLASDLPPPQKESHLARILPHHGTASTMAQFLHDSVLQQKGGGWAMIIEADVKCYHCGHVSGQVVGEADKPFQPELFHPFSAADASALRQAKDRLRCYRCGGPIFLDDIRVLSKRRRSSVQARDPATGKRKRSAP